MSFLIWNINSWNLVMSLAPPISNIVWFIFVFDRWMSLHNTVMHGCCLKYLITDTINCGGLDTTSSLVSVTCGETGWRCEQQWWLIRDVNRHWLFPCQGATATIGHVYLAVIWSDQGKCSNRNWNAGAKMGWLACLADY